MERFESNGLKVGAGKLIHMEQEKEAGFYTGHDGKTCFTNNVEYMTSGQVGVQGHEGDNASVKNDDLMEATSRREGK